MAWLSLVPSIILCAAILVIPGLLVTLAVRVRGFDALALSPACLLYTSPSPRD